MECTLQELEDKLQDVLHGLKLTPNSSATLAEILPDLREDLNLNVEDTFVILRLLNSRLDWNLMSSGILRLFNMQTQS